MQEEIIKTAILGTEKYQMQFGANPALQEIATQITDSQIDKEDAFLKNAAVVFLYEECGQTAFESKAALLDCPEESKPLLTNPALAYFKTALDTKDDILLNYLIRHCEQKNQIIPAVLIPKMLNKALENKKKAAKFIVVCGETGRWLCQLNPKWQIFFVPETEIEDWETGDLASRKSFLMELRKQNPAEVIAHLERIFPQENANDRAEFLEILRINPSLDDAPFLQNLAKDKSKKVKETASDLLKSLQGSEINLIFLDYLTKAIIIKEQKGLLTGKKKVLEFDKDLTPTEEVFKSGIQKISSEKGTDDYIYWIAQMLCFVKPTILAEKLGSNEDELIQLFLDNKAFKNLQFFLGNVALTFQSQSWAKAILEKGKDANIDLLQILDAPERMPYYNRFVEQSILVLLDNLLEQEDILIPEGLFFKIFDKLKKSPYQITEPVYRRLALHIPPILSDYLQKQIGNEAETNYQMKYFSNQVIEMIRLLEIRKSMLK